MARATRRRRTVVHHLAAALMVLAAAFGSLVVSIVVWVHLDPDCLGYDDEGVYLAPRSWRGRLQCGADDGGGISFLLEWGLLIALGVVLLVAVAAWLHTRSFQWLVSGLVLLLLLPLVPLAVLPLLPGSCSAEQRATYGAEGCQRDAELR